MVSGLTEHVAQHGVAGVRDATPVLRPVTRVLAGHHAQVGHELTGRGEAAEVADLGDDGHRTEEGDAAEALQGSQQLPMPTGLGTLHQRTLEAV